MDPYCCNPFKKKDHKSRHIPYAKLRNVSNKLVATARKLNIRLKVNTKLCKGCHASIYKKIKTFQSANPAAAGAQGLAGEQSAHQSQQISVARRMPQRRDAPRTAKELAAKQIAQQQAGTEQNMDVDSDVVLDEAPVERISSGSSDEFIDEEEFLRRFNKLLPLIGANQIDVKKMRSQSYCKKEFEELTHALESKLFKLPERIESEPINASSEQEILMQLHDKFAKTTNKGEKIKILSILPRSWSAYRIHKEFKVSMYLSRLVKKLVDEKGILCGPNKRIATHVIDPATVKAVKDFYLDEDVSHTCPGKRDYVIVNENNEKIHEQRRLLLMNLDEAYALFKQQYSDLKIGFSTFASLRPPQCLLALSSSGTHSVCVCVYHQNVKLIFRPMKSILGLTHYRDLLMRMMCAEPTEKCHLMECKECPGVAEMEKYLERILNNNAIDEVPHSQWIVHSGKI